MKGVLLGIYAAYRCRTITFAAARAMAQSVQYVQEWLGCANVSVSETPRRL